MSTHKLFNLNILSETAIPTPEEVFSRVKPTVKAKDTVLRYREVVRCILNRKDPRLLVIVGPCSIHDVRAAEEFAAKLSTLAEELKEHLVLVMRVYFEKPRTTVGWKGFVNDPDLDDTFKIGEGLERARKLLCSINDMGMPAATEALDPVVIQYFSDLVSWIAIGARTTESQTHREMASGLSAPVGIKNGTDGSIETALNALKAVSRSHHFLGIKTDGTLSVLETRGNRYAHIVLRGGSAPNYDSESIKHCEDKLKNAGLEASIMVDCSHGNSLKKAALQKKVLSDCAGQIAAGNRSIIGFMLESNLFPGRQDVGEDLSALKYGVSITDECIGWDETEAVLKKLYEEVGPALAARI